MELPFKKSLGGSIRGGNITRHKKATKLVADWWFNRMRFEFGIEKNNFQSEGLGYEL